MENNDFEAKNLYIPPKNFRSLLSRIVWNTYASDEPSGWKDGEIVRPPAEDGDNPLLFDFPVVHYSIAPSEWIKSLTVSIDQTLPDCEILIDCLECDSLTIRPYAPAFRITGHPTPESAAHCLIASRVLCACKEDIIPPVFMSTKNILDCLNTISYLSIMLGGEEAFLHAMTLLGSSETFLIQDVKYE